MIPAFRVAPILTDAFYSKCGDAAGNIGPSWQKAITFLTTMTEEDAGNTNSWSHEWWDVAGDPMLST